MCVITSESDTDYSDLWSVWWLVNQTQTSDLSSVSSPVNQIQTIVIYCVWWPVNQIQTSDLWFVSEPVNHKFLQWQTGCNLSFVCAPNMFVSFGIWHFVLCDHCVSCLCPKLLVLVGTLFSMTTVLVVCVPKPLVSVVPWRMYELLCV